MRFLAACLCLCLFSCEKPTRLSSGTSEDQPEPTRSIAGDLVKNGRYALAALGADALVNGSGEILAPSRSMISRFGPAVVQARDSLESPSFFLTIGARPEDLSAVVWLDEEFGYADLYREVMVYCRPYQATGNPGALALSVPLDMLDCWDVMPFSDIRSSSRHPNGTIARSGEAFYFADGSLLRSTGGTWYRNSGTTLKNNIGRIYWGNGYTAVYEDQECRTAAGQVIRSTNGKSYYPGTSREYFDGSVASYPGGRVIMSADGRIGDGYDDLFVPSETNLEMRYLSGATLRAGERRDGEIFYENGRAAALDAGEERPLARQTGARVVTRATRNSGYIAVEYRSGPNTFLVQGNDFVLPAAKPGNVAASSITSTSFRISWIPIEPFDGFLYSISAPGGDAPPCNEGTATSGAHFDAAGLKSGQTYRINVCARSGAVNSEPAKISVQTLVLAPPPAPTGASASASGVSRINLAWTSGGGSTSAFQIAYQVGNSAPVDCHSGTVISAAMLGLSTTFQIQQLAPGTSITSRICALNANDPPAYTSVIVSAVTPSATADAVLVQQCSSLRGVGLNPHHSKGTFLVPHSKAPYDHTAGGNIEFGIGGQIWGYNCGSFSTEAAQKPLATTSPGDIATVHVCNSPRAIHYGLNSNPDFGYTLQPSSAGGSYWVQACTSLSTIQAIKAGPHCTNGAIGQVFTCSQPRGVRLFNNQGLVPGSPTANQGIDYGLLCETVTPIAVCKG